MLWEMCSAAHMAGWDIEDDGDEATVVDGSWFAMCDVMRRIAFWGSGRRDVSTAAALHDVSRAGMSVRNGFSGRNGFYVGYEEVTHCRTTRGTGRAVMVRCSLGLSYASVLSLSFGLQIAVMLDNVPEMRVRVF
jgi:hypothetical protein